MAASAAHRAIVELDGSVRAVAEGLVLRGATAAQGDAVAYLVGKAVGGDHRQPAAQPQWSAHTLGRILDHADRQRQVMLDRLARGPIPGDQASRWAVVHLP